MEMGLELKLDAFCCRCCCCSFIALCLLKINFIYTTSSPWPGLTLCCRLPLLLLGCCCCVLKLIKP